MINNHFLIVLMSFFILLAGCNTAKKAYNRGDYDRAVILSVEKLRSKSNNKRTTDVLARAWPRAVQAHEDQIAFYTASNDRFKWERVVDSYERLNRLNELVRRCPACESVVDSGRLYIDELNDACQNAAEVRYNAGIQSLDPGNRERSRDAVEHFMVVERMVPDFRDTRERIEEALSYATINVVVLVPPLQSRSLSISHEFFHNKVMVFLNTDRRMSEYVRFFYPDEASAEGIDRPDHEVWLQFDEFVVGQTTREAPSPPAQDLFISFTAPIYDQVTNRLRRFYASY